MAREVWFDPNHPATFVIRDNRLGPPPPSGYVQAETADGGTGGDPLSKGSPQYGRAQQEYQPGQSSGGYPAYGPDTGPNMNGILHS